MHNTIFTLPVGPSSQRNASQITPRGEQSPTGWGGRGLDAAPTSAGLTRDPERAASLFTPWFGNRCPSFSTGFESYRSTRVGWDGMGWDAFPGGTGGDHSSLRAQEKA